MNLRKKLARITFVLSILSLIWLILGMFEFVPFLLKLPNETSLRAHASMTVIFLLIASWGFWNEG
ncbi:MAG: hypothetical protein EXR41_03785 [Candidatus Methylopumilus sp.]|nr:hypothetical protein [Candidatus Methylopumilus sp.]